MNHKLGAVGAFIRRCRNIKLLKLFGLYKPEPKEGKVLPLRPPHKKTHK